MQDPDLVLPDDQIDIFNRIADNMNQISTRYNDDERFKDILIRIRNFISEYFQVFYTFIRSGSKKNRPGICRVHAMLHSLCIIIHLVTFTYFYNLFS